MAATIIVTAKETVKYEVEMTEAEYEEFLADPDEFWWLMSVHEHDPRETMEYEVVGHEVTNYRKEIVAA